MIRKIHIINNDVINISDNYGMLPISYAALLGNKELVVLFIKLNSKLASNKPITPNAIKKFSPMLKNLPKLKANIDDESLLQKINTLTDQLKRSFSSFHCIST